MKCVWVLVLVCLIACYVMAEAEAQNKDTLSDKEKKLEVFEKWLTDNGFLRKFKLGIIPGQGTGGISTEELTDQDYLLKVPVDKLVLKTEVRNINGWDDWKGSVEPLVIWILREQINDNSFYKPYIDILPEDFTGHPLTWEDEDVKLMQGTQLDFFYQRSMHLLTFSYEHLVENLFKPQREIFPEEQFTFEKYLWAYLCVTTRAWKVLIPGEEEDLALVPLADMLNHQNHGGVGAINVAGDYFMINSTQSYVKGVQVYDSYGDKSNFDLLSAYGFLLDENEFDAIVMHFGLDENHPAFMIAKPELEIIDPDYPTMLLDYLHPPHEFLRMFRIAYLSQHQYGRIHDVIKFKGVDLDLEAQATRSAINTLKRMKQTNDKEMQELLSKENRSDNQNMIIKLRKSEGEVMEHSIEQLRQMWRRVFMDSQLPGRIPV